jgi:nucleoside-diphosphate-sugar epimerase
MLTTTLILGGTGNTGRRLIELLLLDQQHVRAIVRSKERFHEIIPQNDCLQVIEADVLDMEDGDFENCVQGCDCIVSCLGHNMTFKGMYGQPRRLVTDAIKRSCGAIKKTQPTKPVKIILMGSNGVANPDGMDDVRPSGERALLSVIRALVPPHSDNEKAAAFLSNEIGVDDANIEWVVVRPDELIEGVVSKYDVFAKPQQGLFGGGQTTRSNVAHFMGDLIMKDEIWNKWLYQMPVPMNEKSIN